jgi:predicted metalloprotease with PDZ domain
MPVTRSVTALRTPPRRSATATHNAPIRYRIEPKNPAAHLFEVSVTVNQPDPAGQRFMLPTWIPGSYMIREFARHIVTLVARQGARVVGCRKIDKSVWECVPLSAAKGPLTLTYEVYAYDLSVRGAHLDASHGFFNGACVFLLPLGMESAPCEVDILPPEGTAYAHWRVATSLSQTQALVRRSGQKRLKTPANAGLLHSKAFGTYTAAHYDELIDHPVEMGDFAHATFEACGVTHHVVITGRHRADMTRISVDLKRICEAQIALFEPTTHAAPFSEYWFLVMAVGDGYGGLEHRASTALICTRDDLPVSCDKKITPGYRRFLGLASHEYFHAWNVKRIAPAVFVPHDLTRENLTRELWFFEGITSYYDDLFLVRSGLIEPLSYLELVAENLGRVMSQPGRLKQSLTEASFDAWIKYYRADENTPNSQVSYYQKGGLIGLALDLTLRHASKGKKTLDDLMRALWRHYGKDGRGVHEGVIEKLASDIAGTDLTSFFAAFVHGRDDPDFKSLFANLAIDLNWRTPNGWQPNETPTSWLGAKITADAHGEAILANVFDHGPAQQAGLSALDVVVAVDGLRVQASNLERRIRAFSVGSAVTLHAFRRDELMVFNVTLETQPAHVCMLTMRDTPIDAKRRRNDWLFGNVDTRPATAAPAA